MGMYTEIYVNVTFIEDLPEDVRIILDRMCEVDINYFAENDHLPYRWGLLFNDNSYYTPKTNVANFTYDKISKQWSLLGKGDIKNYENEIEMFFKFIDPYVDAPVGNFIGYSRYEENNNPMLYFKVTENQEDTNQ